MSLETLAVVCLLLAFVLARRHELTLRLVRAEARVRSEPMLPLMANRKLPWE